jgi:hypothetical protein
MVNLWQHESRGKTSAADGAAPPLRF